MVGMGVVGSACLSCNSTECDGMLLQFNNYSSLNNNNSNNECCEYDDDIGQHCG